MCKGDREAATGVILYEKVFLEISQNSRENTCARESLQAQACNLNKKVTLAQVFSYGFCKSSKNTSFNRTPLGDCS